MVKCSTRYYDRYFVYNYKFGEKDKFRLFFEDCLHFYLVFLVWSDISPLLCIDHFKKHNFGICLDLCVKRSMVCFLYVMII